MAIDPNIRKAYTLNSSFYKDQQLFEQSLEKIFARSWQYIGPSQQIQDSSSALPFTFMENTLNEPFVFTRDANAELRCLSNVCTHRGNLLVKEAGTYSRLSCNYHGRCFHLDGHFKSMPAFKEVENFPSEEDHLKKIPFKEWMPLLFASIDPMMKFDELIAPIEDRMSFLPLESLVWQEDKSVEYVIDANWALYCDNYLEGFHIPFVHPGLNSALDPTDYAYQLYPWCNLQIGIAKDSSVQSMAIPKGHPEEGKAVYAYYWWLFPNLMLNFYPWGLSLNLIQPLTKSTCKIVYHTFLYKDNQFNWEQDVIEKTEMEDQEIVEQVQLGVNSRFYSKGRFSPTMETGVHHFHQLITKAMK